MSFLVSVLFVGTTAAWLSIHQIVKRKLRNLSNHLPAAYQSAIAAPTSEVGSVRLIPLAIDLVRKEHSNVPFEALSEKEQRVALHAFAVEEQPRWVVTVMKLRLQGVERRVVEQLQYIKESRPTPKPVHFGAIHRQLQLRSRPEV